MGDEDVEIIANRTVLTAQRSIGRFVVQTPGNERDSRVGRPIGCKPFARARLNVLLCPELGKLLLEFLIHRQMDISIEFDEVGEQNQRALDARDQLGLW